MRTSIPVIFVASLMVLASLSVLRADEPYGFRANGQGRFPDATPVTEWGPDKNVVWKTPMPNWSNACPVLCDDRLFVCSEPTTLICVSLADGKLLWQKSNSYADILTDPAEQAKIEENAKRGDELKAQIDAKEKERQAAAEVWSKDKNATTLQKVKDLDREIKAIGVELSRVSYALPRAHAENGYSSATPVTDGKNVWAVFGNGVVVCYDKDGTLIWRRIVEQPALVDTLVYGSSASPLLAGNVLLVQYNNLFGLDAATGKELWKTDVRPGYGTAALAKIGDEYVVYTPYGAAVTVSNGTAIATDLGGITQSHDSTGPLVQDGVLYYIDEKQWAYRLPATAAGRPEKIWENAIVTDPILSHIPHRYYATPLLHEGLLYNVTNESKVLTVVDAETGKTVYENTDLRKRLGGLVYASPTLAGKYVVLMSYSGTALVLEPGREYKEVAENKLEPLRSSPVFAGSRMYVRTLKTLYCIGK